MHFCSPVSLPLQTQNVRGNVLLPVPSKAEVQLCFMQSSDISNPYFVFCLTTKKRIDK